MKKKLAAFFSWFISSLAIIGSLTFLFVSQFHFNNNTNTDLCHTEISHDPWTWYEHMACQTRPEFDHFEHPYWVWITFAVFSTLTIGVLIFREISVYHGKKIVAGILTILFANIVGGVLTLTIPQSELKIKTDDKNVDIDEHMTFTDIDDEKKKMKLKDYEKMYQQGKISLDDLSLQRKAFFLTLFSTITSWTGGVVTALSGIYGFSRGYYAAENAGTLYRPEIIMVHHEFPVYAWVLWGIYIAIIMGLLAYREYVVRCGRSKKGIAIAVLILASIPGGILTLLIPEEAAHVDNSYSDRVVRFNQNNIEPPKKEE